MFAALCKFKHGNRRGGTNCYGEGGDAKKKSWVQTSDGLLAYGECTENLPAHTFFTPDQGGDMGSRTQVQCLSDNMTVLGSAKVSYKPIVI